MNQSKQDRADENLQTVTRYLDSLNQSRETLPMRKGRPDIASISEATGLDRQVFYRNKRIMSALIKHVGGSDATAGGIRTCGRCEVVQREHNNLQRRLDSLQGKYVECDTERQELRKKLLQQEAVEEILTSGRRWIP